MINEQNSQHSLLESHRNRFAVLLAEEATAEKTKLFREISLDSVRELVRWCEKMYPEREKAFTRFYQEADKRFEEHLLKIKYMVYLLDEPVAKAMIRLIERQKDFMFLVDDEEGSARFKRNAWGKSCICYKKISKTASYQPPYKTFFHEFGHAMDALIENKFPGKNFYSDRFVHAQQAEKKRVVQVDGKRLIMEKCREAGLRTIHQWAEWDLENSLLQCSLDLLQGRIDGSHSAEYVGLSAGCQFELLEKVVYDLFLVWNGRERFKTICQASGMAARQPLTGLYLDVKTEMERGLVTARGIPALPRDIFGGLTGNQIGGGHSVEYWYRTKGLCRGRRINQISREAFAGYFEYRVLGLDRKIPVIDPGGRLPCMVKALEEMLKQVIGKAGSLMANHSAG